MATTMGEEASAFIRACEVIHSLVEQGKLQPDDRVLIEVSMTERQAPPEDGTGNPASTPLNPFSIDFSGDAGSSDGSVPVSGGFAPIAIESHR